MSEEEQIAAGLPLESAAHRPAIPRKRLSPRGMISTPEYFVVLTSLVFGGIFALVIPFGAGWDEETHLVRTWDLAHLVLLPDDVVRNQLPYPILYQELSYRRQLLPHPIDVEDWLEKLELPLDSEGLRYSELGTRSVYPPILLFPHALGIRYLGLTERLPALPAVYASRLLGVLAYAALAWLAVRMVPFGKWTLAVLALTPTALFLSATIGTDPLSNGFGLVFVSACLATAHRRQVGWLSMAAIIGLSLLLFMAKPNMVALAVLPVLILAPARFRMKGGLAILGIGLAVLGLVLAGGWSSLAYSPDLAVSGAGTARFSPGQVLSTLLAFSRAAPLDILDNGGGYLEQWIARYGYDYWDVPPISYALFLGALGAAIVVDGPRNAPSHRTRIGLGLTFCLAVLLTQLLLYVKDSQVGGLEIQGVQGRYFIPFAPLLFLSVIGIPQLKSPSPVSGSLARGLALASFSVYAAGLVLSYYVTCGGALLQEGVCTLPAYKNWMPDARYTAPLVPGQRYIQEIQAECDGMQEVQLWIDQSSPMGRSLTEVTIQDAGDDRVLASRRLTEAELPAGDWLTIRFAPEVSSAGRTYLLAVFGKEAMPGSGARLALTLKPEYAQGQLRQDGQPLDVDLVFKYSCLVGGQRALQQVMQ